MSVRTLGRYEIRGEMTGAGNETPVSFGFQSAHCSIV